MDPSPLLFLAALAIVFWLLIIRPTQKRQKAAAELQNSLNVGDDVMLTSGLFGTVVELLEDRIVLELGPGVRVQALRGAVATVIRPEAAADAESIEPVDETADPGEHHENDDKGER